MKNPDCCSLPEMAVVLAAGKGTRMGSLTAHCPKPLLEVAGKPILTRILEGLKAAGVQQVCLVIGYLGEKIRKHYGGGDCLGLKIHYIEQKQLNGTGGALLLARDFCHSPFFMTFGDILLHPPEHYASVARVFAERNPDAVLAANYVDDPYMGAAVYFDAAGRASALVEKPPKGTSDSNYNQAGCFIFRPEIFPILEGLTLSPRGEIELTGAINELIRLGKTVQVYTVSKGNWIDIGTPQLLEEAGRMLANG